MSAMTRSLVDRLVRDELWALVEPLLPPAPRHGRRRVVPDCNCFAALVVRARTSTPGRCCPPRSWAAAARPPGGGWTSGPRRGVRSAPSGDPANSSLIRRWYSVRSLHVGNSCAGSCMRVRWSSSALALPTRIFSVRAKRTSLAMATRPGGARSCSRSASSYCSARSRSALMLGCLSALSINRYASQCRSGRGANGWSERIAELSCGPRGLGLRMSRALLRFGDGLCSLRHAEAPPATLPEMGDHLPWR
jgi:hypothetical protein